ncbi:MAG: ABC-ATPase domain-containing protein [Gemmatimonadota bacterium]
MKPSSTLEELASALRRIDGQGYGAYKRIRGAWRGPDFTLHVDHVQGDPFATPSRLRLHLPPAAHGIPAEAWETRPRRVGLCDYLLRVFRDACQSLPRVGGSGKSGLVIVSVESPIVVERAGCTLDAAGLTLRFRVGLPARGRRCLGRSAATLLTEHLPRVLDAVRWKHVEAERAWAWIRTTEDHDHLQRQLAQRGLVGFVRDGSILPRASGVSQEPLRDAVPFRSPPKLRVTLPTLHHGEVTGMAIPTGVTVVTGGGFHGKTTLLEALQYGVFPHVPGDGREWTVTVPDAVKVRSEDGRSVSGVDLRPFIHDLPLGRDTARFTTPDASGSTSLAADIVEALEAGTSLLLMDEDTCATNLMVRDARMQELVERETITPLIDRVRELREAGVSTLLVTGGGGDYLDVADTVVLMQEYLPREVTTRAREVAAAHPTGRRIGEPEHPLRHTDRVPAPESFDPRRRSGKVKIRTRGSDAIQFGEQELDLGEVEQLADYGQARAVGAMLWELQKLCDGRRPIPVLVHEVVEKAIREGLPSIEDSPELALPRPQEVAKAVNRLRSLRIL